MSIRVTLLIVFVAALAIYAWKDWFVSLCGLILLMAVIQHPDMPKNIMGIQGLNPWNMLMFSVALAWLISRRRDRLIWDMPRYINVMILLYVGVILIGFLRMIGDRGPLAHLPTGYIVSEYLINCVKWVVPGLLIFDACRTQRRVVIALGCVLMLHVLLAVQVLKWIPLSSAMSGSSLDDRTIKIINNEIGYSRVNMSMLLAGASWAIVATLPLVKRRPHRLIVIGMALVTCLGQALTAGRMGYVTWAVVGLILCSLRWRRTLFLAPFVPIVIAVTLPGTAERMLQGFGQTSVSGDTITDTKEVTAGRDVIWPHVVDKITESPIVGYGREAMVRTGLTHYLKVELNEEFSHPHNAYLEMLLDNGLVGFLLIIPFYVVVIVHSTRLFLDRANPLCSGVGGVTLALVLAFLVASMGSQTFYPREGAVGMWCAIGLMLRLHVERSHVRIRAPQRAIPSPFARVSRLA